MIITTRRQPRHFPTWQLHHHRVMNNVPLTLHIQPQMPALLLHLTLHTIIHSLLSLGFVRSGNERSPPRRNLALLRIKFQHRGHAGQRHDLLCCVVRSLVEGKGHGDVFSIFKVDCLLQPGGYLHLSKVNGRLREVHAWFGNLAKYQEGNVEFLLGYLEHPEWFN